MSDSSKHQAATKLSWDSPRLAQLEHLWRKERVPPTTEETDALTLRINQLVDILKKEAWRKELAEIAASCSTIPAREKETSEFAAALPVAITIACVELGDRETLVTLLAARYPKQVNLGCDTEYYIVRDGGIDDLLILINSLYGKPRGIHFRRDLEQAIARGFQRDKVVGKEDIDLLERAVKWYNDPKNGDKYRLGGKFTDPILILTDAYFRAKDKTVRHDLAVAIRHAFTGLGVTGETDTEFVENAVKWYAKHKDRLELNLKYSSNANAPGFFDYETNPLFLVKASEKKDQ